MGGYDIAYALQELDLSVLETLSIEYSNFRTEVTARMKEFTSSEHEYSEKKAVTTNVIMELQRDIDRLKSDMDTAKLQQKILDKKISNACKDEEELIEQVAAAKAERDSLCLKMVDLQQESEKRKGKKLMTWDAIKRGCQVYKENLDFHIHLEDVNGQDYIKVSFFTQNEHFEKEYYVCMSHQDDRWRVEEIKPALKKEYRNHLMDVLDPSNKFEIHNATAFLCRLRNIFKKYYINKTDVK